MLRLVLVKPLMVMEVAVEVPPTEHIERSPARGAWQNLTLIWSILSQDSLVGFDQATILTGKGDLWQVGMC